MLTDVSWGRWYVLFFTSHLMTTIFQYRNYCCWQRRRGRKTSRTLPQPIPPHQHSPLPRSRVETWDGGGFSLLYNLAVTREVIKQIYICKGQPPQYFYHLLCVCLSLVSNQYPGPNAQPALESRGRPYWCIRFTGIWNIQGTFRI
jgi:hypothetical protein